MAPLRSRRAEPCHRQVPGAGPRRQVTSNCGQDAVLFETIRSATIREMRRAEAVWVRILGVLLILLGLTLFASPQVTYTSRRKIKLPPSTEITTKEKKTIVIPRAVAVLVMGAGLRLGGKAP